MQIGIGISLTGGGQRPFSIAGLLTASNGFYFDFTSGATGAGIASVTSRAPSTKSAVQASGSLQPIWTDAASDYAIYDGIDDFLLGDLNPASSMVVGACVRVSTTGGFPTIIGSTTAGGNRGGSIGLNSANQAAAAWGGSSTLVATGGAALTNGADYVILARFTQTTVDLWLNGVSIYSGAANLTPPPNTTVPYAVGGLNSSGTVGNTWNSRIYRACAIQAAPADAQAILMSRELGLGIVSI